MKELECVVCKHDMEYCGEISGYKCSNCRYNNTQLYPCPICENPMTVDLAHFYKCNKCGFEMPLFLDVYTYVEGITVFLADKATQTIEVYKKLQDTVPYERLLKSRLKTLLDQYVERASDEIDGFKTEMDEAKAGRCVDYFNTLKLMEGFWSEIDDAKRVYEMYVSVCSLYVVGFYQNNGGYWEELAKQLNDDISRLRLAVSNSNNVGDILTGEMLQSRERWCCALKIICSSNNLIEKKVEYLSEISRPLSAFYNKIDNLENSLNLLYFVQEFLYRLLELEKVAKIQDKQETEKGIFKQCQALLSWVARMENEADIINKDEYILVLFYKAKVADYRIRRNSLGLEQLYSKKEAIEWYERFLEFSANWGLGKQPVGNRRIARMTETAQKAIRGFKEE